MRCGATIRAGWLVAAAALAGCSEGGQPGRSPDLMAAADGGAGRDMGMSASDFAFMSFDLASGADFGQAADLGAPDAPSDGAPFDSLPFDGFVDGGSAGDLGFPSDAALSDGAPPDDGFPPPGDGGGPGSCPLMMAGGSNGQCIGSGICQGHVYAVDCNGATCTCSIDMAYTGSFVETPGTCGNLQQAWAQGCQF
jgi:hypothetical protein